MLALCIPSRPPARYFAEWIRLSRGWLSLVGISPLIRIGFDGPGLRVMSRWRFDEGWKEAIVVNCSDMQCSRASGGGSIELPLVDILGFVEFDH